MRPTRIREIFMKKILLLVVMLVPLTLNAADMDAVQTTTNSASSTIIRVGANKYMCGDRYMTTDELGVYFQERCLSAYKQWYNGKSIQDAGIALSIFGPVICLPFGLSLYATCVSGSPYYIMINQTPLAVVDINIHQYRAGIALMTIGAAITIASVPLLAVGTSRKNNAYNVYNGSCKNDLSLNLQIKNNGLGLALNF